MIPMLKLLDRSAMPPEQPLGAVADGNLADLAWPILIAAACQDQYEAFCFQEGLICCETRRFVGSPESFQGSRYDDPGKILLLLPGWGESPATAALVDWWVKRDRYTVEMSSPPSPEMRDRRKTIACLVGLCLLAWVVVIWMMNR